MGMLRRPDRDGVIVRATSLASQLPQVDRVCSVGNWSAVRPPSRAGSHTVGMGVGSWRLVGCLAAFAGKPAPTVGMSVFSWRLVGCQAAFAGKPAPTVGMSVFSWRLVGCQAAIAGKPAPTVGMSVFSWKLVGCQAAFASRLAPIENKAVQADRMLFTTQQDER